MRIVYQRSLLGLVPLGQAKLVGSVTLSLEPDSSLTVKGWVRGGAAARVRGVRLHVGGVQRADSEVNLRSPEAAIAFPDDKAAVMSGFQITVPLIPGTELDAYFWILLEGGGIQHAATALIDLSSGKEAPIFVVGSPRSGTSAVGLGLQRALQLTGYGESHLAPLISTLFETISKFYQNPNNKSAANLSGVMLSGVDNQEWIQRQARTLRQIYRQLHTADNFIDKTPGWPMLKALPDLMIVWPNLKIIFAKRRGIENVQSRQRKFPSSAFESHCRDWAAAMDVWLAIRDAIPRNQRIEIDQFDIVKDPEDVAKRLAQFVDLPTAVTARLAKFLTENKPEQTIVASDQSISLEQTSWTSAERQIFIKYCQSVMTAFGYSMDSSYYAIPA